MYHGMVLSMHSFSNYYEFPQTVIIDLLSYYNNLFLATLSLKIVTRDLINCTTSPHVCLTLLNVLSKDVAVEFSRIVYIDCS